MKPSVYLETSVIGCLAMRPSSVLRIAANQQISRDFWDNHRQRFDQGQRALWVSLDVWVICAMRRLFIVLSPVLAWVPAVVSRRRSYGGDTYRVG